MTRIAVASLHTFLATLLLGGGVLLVVQAQINASWESGFYGHLSTMTSALLATSILMIVIAIAGYIGSFGFALGVRWAGWMLIAVSIFLVAATPSPLSWLIALSAFAILFDLWIRGVRDRLNARDDDDSA